MSHNDGKKKLPIYVGHAKMTTSLVGSLHLRDKIIISDNNMFEKKKLIIVQVSMYIYIEKIFLDILEFTGKSKLLMGKLVSHPLQQ